VKSEEELNDVIAKLKKEGYYANEYPYFNEASPFYLQSDDTTIRLVPEELRAPSWTDNENLHIYQL
jgi:hypothetical protein